MDDLCKAKTKTLELVTSIYQAGSEACQAWNANVTKLNTQKSVLAV